MAKLMYEVFAEVGDSAGPLNRITKVIKEYAGAGWRVHTFIHEGGNEVRSAAWVVLMEREAE